ncbi:hypothetical protein BDW22DRAFT_1351372 [Trametopsis cervina]|nr:hypothetical protein BDW22DRAFT_1351372 [Trametopsis cervina]
MNRYCGVLALACDISWHTRKSRLANRPMCIRFADLSSNYGSLGSLQEPSLSSENRFGMTD